MEKRTQLQEAHLREAKPLPVNFEGVALVAVMPKVFSTGSIGWYASTKLLIQDTLCQVAVTVTVVGSKPKPDGEPSVQDFTSPIYAPDAPPSLPGEQNGRLPGKHPRKRS